MMHTVSTGSMPFRRMAVRSIYCEPPRMATTIQRTTSSTTLPWPGPAAAVHQTGMQQTGVCLVPTHAWYPHAYICHSFAFGIRNSTLAHTAHSHVTPARPRHTPTTQSTNQPPSPILKASSSTLGSLAHGHVLCVAIPTKRAGLGQYRPTKQRGRYEGTKVEWKKKKKKKKKVKSEIRTRKAKVTFTYGHREHVLL